MVVKIRMLKYFEGKKKTLLFFDCFSRSFAFSRAAYNLPATKILRRVQDPPRIKREIITLPLQLQQELLRLRQQAPLAAFCLLL